MNHVGKVVIQIIEISPDQFAAQSIFDPNKTSDILFSLAKNYYAQAVITRHEEQKRKNGGIINPHTGMVIPTEN